MTKRQPSYTIHKQGEVIAAKVDHSTALATLRQHPNASVKTHGGAQLTPILKAPSLPFWDDYTK